MTPLRWVAMWLCAMCGVTGCASAQKDTMIAELGLAKGVSIGYRTIDGVDKVKTDKIHAEIQAGEVVKAETEYKAYKVVMDKARAALAAGEDVLEASDKARDAATKGVAAWQEFTAYMPELLIAAGKIQQAIADLKGLGL